VILCKLTTKFSVKTVIELLGVQGAWTSLQHTHHTVAWQLEFWKTKVTKVPHCLR